MDSDGSGAAATGITDRVTLGDGSVAESTLPTRGTLPRGVMEVPAPATWKPCALGPGVKPAMFTLTWAEAPPARFLLITITVSAPSEARVAAKAATVSGSGALA